MANVHTNSRRPKEAWATINNMQVRYLDWGGDGTPIIALHGLASSASWYQRVAERLAGEYRVIAPDQRGHGRTSQARSGYDWQTLTSDVVGLMDLLRVTQAAVFGHSWGGHVASNLAMRFPERVTKLVMIDGGFQDGHLLPDASWEVFQNRFRARDVSGTKIEWLERLRDQMADCWGDDLEQTVLSMVFEDDLGQLRDILHPEHHAEVLVSMWNEPPSEVLPRVQCPTLVVPAGPRPHQANSEFARMRNVMVAAAIKIIPDCTVEWIPETMHDIGYHKPDELVAVIRKFLGQPS